MITAAVRREWIACRAILLQPMRERRAQGLLWVTWMLLGLAALGATAALGTSPQKWRNFGVFTGLPVAMLLLQWWVLLIGSMMAQCRASAIRLLPHMRARAMRVTIGAWACAVLLMTLLLGVPLGCPIHVAVATGLVLLEMSMLFGFVRVAVFLAIVFVANNTGRAVKLWVAEFVRGDGFLAMLVLLLLYEGCTAILRMFGTAARARAWPAPKDGIPPIISVVTRWYSRIAGDDAGKQPPILRVLGAVPFGGTRLMLVLLVALCAPLRMWNDLVDKTDAHDGLFVVRCFVLFVMLAWQAVLVALAAVSPQKRHDEQALFRLTAGAPAAADLNRQLARHLLTGQVRMAAEMAALTLLALFALGASAGEVGRAAAVCTISLALAGEPLRDFARARTGGARSLLFYLLLLAIGAATVVALSGAGSGAEWLAGALVTAGLSGWFVRARWNRMLSALPAYPAQRA